MSDHHHGGGGSPTSGKPPRNRSAGAKSTNDAANNKNNNSESQVNQKLMDMHGGRNNNLPTTLMFDHVSPATRLLEKRRQMFEVQEAVNSQKEEFSRREDAFRRREDGLRRKDLELQESLIKFNKFLQENESKRNRALKRTAEERKQRESKEGEIKKLEAQLKTKLKEEMELKGEVAVNLKYQDFLESVCQSMSKYFPEISDILNRHKTLRDANTYLLEKQQADEGANDNTLREYRTFRKDKENQLLNENNEIADLQVRVEQGETRTTKLQAEIDMHTHEASDKALQLGQILSSVTNILERCDESFRIRHNKPQGEKSNRLGMPLSEQCIRTASKLDEIAMFMVDFRDIREEYYASLRGGGGGGGGVGGSQSIITAGGADNNTTTHSLATAKSVTSMQESAVIGNV